MLIIQHNNSKQFKISYKNKQTQVPTLKSRFVDKSK